ncbi:MAG: strictosidine synthase family protein [Parvibaculaceae bacterium]
MSKTKGWLTLAGILCLTMLSIVTWRFLAAAGYFTAIKLEVPAICSVVPSPPGPEDIEVDRARGLAFVSASDRRALAAGNAASRGGIYVIDLTAPTDHWQVRPVTAAEPADFNPHGLSLYIGADGKRRLFVVNHLRNKTHAIEIFDVAADGGLTHVRTVVDPLLVSPNDVVAVGPDSFYVTNDHGTGNQTKAMIDDFLLLTNADVVYFDGKTMSVAATGLSFANGINKSLDGKSIYVSETMGLRLHIYDRNEATGVLTFRDLTPLGTGLDNIDVLDDGALLIASHPRLTSFIAHARDPKELSPSQVLRVELDPKGVGGKAGTIYLNLGKQVSGATVAAGYRDLMLIGNSLDPNILVCQQSKEIKGY